MFESITRKHSLLDIVMSINFSFEHVIIYSLVNILFFLIFFRYYSKKKEVSVNRAVENKKPENKIAETKNDETAINGLLNNNPDLFPALNETLLKVWANKKANDHGGVNLIQLYISPEASQKYYIYFEIDKFPTKDHKALFTDFLRKEVFRYKLKEIYRSNLPLRWQEEWTLSTKLADKIDKNNCWTLYKK